MPVRLTKDEKDLLFFADAIASIQNQTDKDWVLVLVDDYSESKAVYDFIEKIKSELKDKLHVIPTDRNYGTGVARNKGVEYASKIGAPFILFNDSDDISDPRRLELVRKAFEDETVNVVYTSFDVIDEKNALVPVSKINKTVLEIIDGHKEDVVEGENAWISIAMKKKYTNLTSCTAVRTSLAVAEPFPNASVSEDCHTWFRYAAYPGKFVFLRDIKGKYRIASGTASRSRSRNADFYGMMVKNDSDGFEKAVTIAKKYNTLVGYDEDEIRLAFYVRLALCIYNGGSVNHCIEALSKAKAISEEKTLYYIERLPCDASTKEAIRKLA